MFYVLVNSVKIGVLKSMAAVMMKFTTSLIVNGQDAFYVYIFYCISIHETVFFFKIYFMLINSHVELRPELKCSSPCPSLSTLSGVYKFTSCMALSTF